ncbi:MAG: hypothetical protein KC502_23050 [Myxococcales bacterium]|nr:hypothetical protein [Myxococcales bacterium]
MVLSFRALPAALPNGRLFTVPPLLIGLLLASVTAPSLPAFARSPVLHERLPRSLVVGRTDQMVRTRPGKGLPDAISTANGQIDRPTKTGEPAPTYLPAPPPGTTPPPRIKADAKTGKQGRLNYRVVFDPSVAPFKRDLVFDEVTAAGELKMSGLGLRPIRPRQDGSRPGFELFWGHITLQLAPNQKTPMPSVAVTSSLRSIAATPPVALTYWRDRAGNMWVSSKKKVTVDLRFVMDAPSRYFASPIADGAVNDDPWTPTLAKPLQAQMQALWPAIGVLRSATRKANLHALSRWFRGFVPGAGPQPGPSLLSGLVLGKTGVCRHRALGFTIMAHSLGIPTHYVMNDAHAFVEVWAPGSTGKGGWLRIDLGGGADELQLHSAKNKRLHQPLFADPLPKPPAYANQVSAGGGATSWAGAGAVKGKEDMHPSARGLSNQPDGQPGPGQPGAAQPGTSQPGGSRTNPGQPKAGQPKTGRDKKAWLRSRAMSLVAQRRPPGAQLAPSSTRKTATRLELKAASQAWVGETLTIAGRLVGPLPAVANQLIEVWLVRPRDPSKGRQIGTAMTQKSGRYQAKIAIPLDARLGVWDLVVRFAGNAKLGPSFSVDR